MNFLFGDEFEYPADDDGDNPTDSVYATDDSRHPDYDVDVTHPMVPDLIENEWDGGPLNDDMPKCPGPEFQVKSRNPDFIPDPTWDRFGTPDDSIDVAWDFYGEDGWA